MENGSNCFETSIPIVSSYHLIVHVSLASETVEGSPARYIWTKNFKILNSERQHELANRFQSLQDWGVGVGDWGVGVIASKHGRSSMNCPGRSLKLKNRDGIPPKDAGNLLAEWCDYFSSLLITTMVMPLNCHLMLAGIIQFGWKLLCTVATVCGIYFWREAVNGTNCCFAPCSNAGLCHHSWSLAAWGKATVDDIHSFSSEVYIIHGCYCTKAYNKSLVCKFHFEKQPG